MVLSSTLRSLGPYNNETLQGWPMAVAPYAYPPALALVILLSMDLKCRVKYVEDTRFYEDVQSPITPGPGPLAFPGRSGLIVITTLHGGAQTMDKMMLLPLSHSKSLLAVVKALGTGCRQKAQLCRTQVPHMEYVKSHNFQCA